jgi:hypothetical protein
MGLPTSPGEVLPHGHVQVSRGLKVTRDAQDRNQTGLVLGSHQWAPQDDVPTGSYRPRRYIGSMGCEGS